MSEEFIRWCRQSWIIHVAAECVAMRNCESFKCQGVNERLLFIHVSQNHAAWCLWWYFEERWRSFVGFIYCHANVIRERAVHVFQTWLTCQKRSLSFIYGYDQRAPQLSRCCPENGSVTHRHNAWGSLFLRLCSASCYFCCVCYGWLFKSSRVAYDHVIAALFLWGLMSRCFFFFPKKKTRVLLSLRKKSRKHILDFFFLTYLCK